MIRRGFWLLVGAAVGVAGYRKASRLARTITGSRVSTALGSGFPRAGAPRARALPAGPGRRATAREVPLAGRGEWARSAVSFVSDVREGMADYRELQDGRRGRSLGSLAEAAEPDRGQRGRSEA
ncbi:MAG TPA: hypothetical protein VK823_26365 [Streptosporangiaceae bacterium]|nr:hypothetical protein [Streptosporangiaceae bacterium]